MDGQTPERLLCNVFVIVVGGIYVANTGFDYSSDVVVELYDKDRYV